MRVCKIDGCDREVRTRGWCQLHYLRQWKHGDPLVVKPQGRHPPAIAPGERFGHLIVLEVAGVRRRKRYYWCKCDCDVLACVEGTALRRGGARRSCGCQKGRGRRKSVAVKHGHNRGNSPSPTYRSWHKMIQRCTNPNDGAWANYGGRGIVVCDRWRSFENFLADLGERPEDKTLDRIDNDGNYEPGNCRWATRSEQQRNRRRRSDAIPTPAVPDPAP